jgi:hypothetical protein
VFCLQLLDPVPDPTLVAMDQDQPEQPQVLEGQQQIQADETPVDQLEWATQVSFTN